MGSVSVEPDVVARYAGLMAASASMLAREAGRVRAAPLDDEAFGSLGRAVHAPGAYEQAARLLGDQLGRAIEALTAAADGLATVAEVYRGADDDGAQAITSTDR